MMYVYVKVESVDRHFHLVQLHNDRQYRTNA